MTPDWDYGSYLTTKLQVPWKNDCDVGGDYEHVICGKAFLCSHEGILENGCGDWNEVILTMCPTVNILTGSRCLVYRVYDDGQCKLQSYSRCEAARHYRAWVQYCKETE